MTIGPGREGGCQCGAVRYRLLAAPLALYACHCRACQKQSSSAFGMSMWMAREAVEWSGTPARIWRTRGDSGAGKQCAFCGECGTRLYHTGEEGDGDDVLSMKAGSLDDPSDLRPSAHIWTRRAHAWMAPAMAEAPCFEGEAEDDALTRHWREAGSAPGT